MARQAPHSAAAACSLNGHETVCAKNGALNNQHTKPRPQSPVLFRLIGADISCGALLRVSITRDVSITSVRLVYISIGTHIPPLLYGRGYCGCVYTPGSELGIKANLLDHVMVQSNSPASFRAVSLSVVVPHNPLL